MSIGRTVMVYDHFNEIASKLPRACGRVCWKTALLVRTNAMSYMRGPKSGRLYRKAPITRKYKASGRKWRQWKAAGAKVREEGGSVRVTVGYKVHRASAPGEAPAIDLGNLRSSISADMTGESTAMVSVSAEYGIPLEYGSRKMAARPYLRPAVEAARPVFESGMRQLEGDLR